MLDELRFEVARQLVSDTELPLAQISAALNFSEPAAFTRAFQRWSGSISPQRWRHFDRADNWTLQTNVRGLLRSAPEDRAFPGARQARTGLRFSVKGIAAHHAREWADAGPAHRPSSRPELPAPASTPSTSSTSKAKTCAALS